MATSTNTRTFILVFLLGVALTAFYVDRRALIARYHNVESRQEQIETGHQRVDALRQNIETTRRRVEDMGSDPAEIEASIRRTKDLVREGERIYRIKRVPGGSVEGGGEVVPVDVAPPE